MAENSGAATPMEVGEGGDREQQREALQTALQDFVECLRELEIVLEDQPDQLHKKMCAWGVQRYCT